MKVKWYFSCSYANTSFKRKSSSTSKCIQTLWNIPSKCVVHYDGKLMKKLGLKTKKERFPIIVSGAFGTKLFGALSIGHNLRGRYG